MEDVDDGGEMRSRHVTGNQFATSGPMMNGPQKQGPNAPAARSRFARMQRLRSRGSTFLLIPIGLLSLLLGARVVSRRFLFPRHEVAAKPVPSDVQQLHIRAADGVDVLALMLPAEPSAPVFVHFHNNRQTAVDALDFGRALRDRGMGVVLMEYRGYALTAGEPSESALYADAEALLAELRGRGIDRKRIVLSGQSLGTGVAAEMARRGHGRALVLMAPYTSIPDLVRNSVPIAPASWLAPDAFATIDKTSSITVPTIVVHGSSDEVVPYWMGEALAGRIASAKLVTVTGARHDEVWSKQRERVLGELEKLAHGE